MKIEIDISDIHRQLKLYRGAIAEVGRRCKPDLDASIVQMVLKGRRTPTLFIIEKALEVLAERQADERERLANIQRLLEETGLNHNN